MKTKDPIAVRRRWRLRKRAFPYLLLLPTFALIAIFMLYPIGNTVFLSFRDHVLTNLKNAGFTGMDNYRALMEDATFRKSAWNSVIWTVSNVLLQAFFGLIAALLLNQSFRCRGIIRALMFTPWAVGGMLVALIWGFLLSESIGPVSDLLLKLGITETRMSWFSSGSAAMGAVILANTWRGIPFFAISILSSLQTIPPELYESAEVDGAGAFRKFFSITLPLIKDTFLLTTLLRTIWTLNMVDLGYGMTRGGPNFSTLTLPMYIMMIFNDTLNAGYASALSVILIVVLLVFSGLYLKLGRYGKGEYY